MDVIERNIGYLRSLNSLVTRISSQDNEVLKDSDIINYYHDFSLDCFKSNNKGAFNPEDSLWSYDGFLFQFDIDTHNALVAFVNSFREFIDASKKDYRRPNYWSIIEDKQEWKLLKLRSIEFKAYFDKYFKRLGIEL